MGGGGGRWGGMKDIEHVITVYATWNDCGLQATLLQNSSTHAPTERRMSFRWLITNVPSRRFACLAQCVSRGRIVLSSPPCVFGAYCSASHSGSLLAYVNQAVLCNAKHAGPANISTALSISRCSSRSRTRVGVGVAQRMIDSREGTALITVSSTDLPDWSPKELMHNMNVVCLRSPTAQQE